VKRRRENSISEFPFPRGKRGQSFEKKHVGGEKTREKTGGGAAAGSKKINKRHHALHCAKKQGYEEEGERVWGSGGGKKGTVRPFEKERWEGLRKRARGQKNSTFGEGKTTNEWKRRAEAQRLLRAARKNVCGEVWRRKNRPRVANLAREKLGDEPCKRPDRGGGRIGAN